jgi:hypothetical protein
MVQRMNQQSKDGLWQMLEKTPEDRRSKIMVEKKSWKQHTTLPPSVDFHVKKKETYLETTRGNEIDFPQL